MDRHILLIGFMGTGKTTVCERLHERLGVPEADTDQMIEQREGMRIPEIFEKKGELYFRDAESRLLKELKDMEPMVISCGGGMAMRPENAALMKQAGLVVLLTAAPETILERVRNDDSRPLLRGHMNTAYISQMMQRRWTRYEAAADVKVATDGRSVDSICTEILGYIMKRRG